MTAIPNSNAPYQDAGWVGRKCAAIPMALWCSTAQALYHLGCMMINGLGGNGPQFKAYASCIARDFDEAYGWLTLLFNDRLGLSWIKEAQDLKKSYFETETTTQRPYPPARIGPNVRARRNGAPRQPPLIIADRENYKQHRTHEGHPENPLRVGVIEDALTDAGLMYEENTLAPRKATEEQVLKCHSSTYKAIVKEDVINRDILSTGDVSISPESRDTAFLAVGGVLTAIDAVMAGQSNTAFCIIRPPGHHASKNVGRGFCIFNNVAVGARYLQQNYNIGKVLIVDWDAHHGDGTQAIFENDPSVFYFSTHASNIYPGTGFEYETGIDHNICNCPITPSNHSDQDIEKAFRERLVPAMKRFKPEFIFISCGFDALETDPLGHLNLTPESFARLTRIVKEIGQTYGCKGIVSCLEGGYDLDGIGEAAVAHVQALKD